jgi:hypothetical protein
MVRSPHLNVPVLVRVQDGQDNGGNDEPEDQLDEVVRVDRRQVVHRVSYTT